MVENEREVLTEMNIMVFDTETANLEKPFCYDLGYCVFDTEREVVVAKRSYIVTDVWNNMMLFSTAYYADKRARYEDMLANRLMTKHKWEWVAAKVASDIEQFGITDAYAFNSDFDKRVFAFNAEWHHTPNPLDNVKIHDIRGYVHKFIAFQTAYQEFCEKHKLFTESGNFATTAESVYRFLSQNAEFDEAHTALADAEIELDILHYCIINGAEWNTDYKVYRSIPRNLMREFKVVSADGEEHIFTYTNKRKLPNDSGIKFTIKGEG